MNASTARPPDSTPAAGDSLIFSADQAQALVRLVEAAPAVRRRYQFFVWTQSQMQALLPHQMLVCGAYQRHRRALVLDTFHSVVLGPELLQQLSEPDGALVGAIARHWVEGRGQPLALDLAWLDGTGDRLRDELGWTHVLVHGVARPQRPAEIESLFILGGTGGGAQLAHRSACLDLLLPHLHSTWQRVTATELELQRPGMPPPLRKPAPATEAPARPARGGITERECQILRWIREGKSNQQIAEVLGISPLTVKNHVQKILRKLGAGNRAQAVAQALALHLIDAADTH